MGKAVAVIGLGAMGMGAAISLARGGFDVTGCDIRESARLRFAPEFGAAVPTPRELPRDIEAVLVFVVNADQTESVLFGPDGVAPLLKPETVVMLCSTIPPAVAESLAKRLEALGLLPLDAPVSGGAAKANSGELTIIASGAARTFEKAEPFLNAISSTVYNLGSKPGQGSAMKMINQLLAGVHIAVAGEALTLGIKAGIDARTIFEVISNSAGSSWMFRDRVPRILEGDYEPRSAVDIFVKDLGIVLDAGRNLSFPLPIAAAAHQMFLAASGMGLGRDDDSSVAKVYASLSGIDIDQKKI